MRGEILSLATLDVRIHFSVVEMTQDGYTGQWIKGTATINPGPLLEGERTGLDPAQTQEEGRRQIGQIEMRNKRMIPWLFNDRQHECLMPRPDLGGQDDEAPIVRAEQAAADIGTMQAITFSLVTSLNQARR